VILGNPTSFPQSNCADADEIEEEELVSASLSLSLYLSLSLSLSLCLSLSLSLSIYLSQFLSSNYPQAQLFEGEGRESD
jgi:hypothetical protein